MYNVLDKQDDNPKVRKASSKRRHKLTGTPIHNNNGRRIGQVKNDVFVKDIISKWILQRPFPCIASDISALHEAERAGAVYVEFTNTETGIIYRASIAKFWTLGKYIDYVGPQQALGLEHFEHRYDPSINQSQTEAQDYTEPSGTGDVMPLHYVSHAPVGVKYEPGIKQMGLWGNE